MESDSERAKLPRIELWVATLANRVGEFENNPQSGGRGYIEQPQCEKTLEPIAGSSVLAWLAGNALNPSHRVSHSISITDYESAESRSTSLDQSSGRREPHTEPWPVPHEMSWPLRPAAA